MTKLKEDFVMSNQVVMVTLEELVPADHMYRKFLKLWKFDHVSKKLKKLEKDNGYKGYGALRLFKCVLLQFIFRNLNPVFLWSFLGETK